MCSQCSNQIYYINDRDCVKGELPTGCQLCLKGAKAVIFVTGLCSTRPSCYYCPISREKWGKDTAYVYTNERKTYDLAEIVAECEKMGAKGVSLSGGDPLVKLDKACHIIQGLKSTFGKEFHIHLYTPGLSATHDSLKLLHNAGLDEIRFHTVSETTKKAIEKALKYVDWVVGAEIPAIPGELASVQKTIQYLDGVGVSFLNLNELEISETNYRRLLARDFVEDNVRPFAVAGSENVALEAIDWGANKCAQLTLHYCSASTKDGVQLKNRLLRTAKRIARPYHEITEDGLLVYGTIAPNRTRTSLRTAARWLHEKFQVPTNLISIRPAKDHIETRWDIVEELAPFFKKNGFKCAIVEQYPTSDELTTTYLPL
jgi:pyruvate formate-lyase activating enzyme-like uncharacterized protein